MRLYALVKKVYQKWCPADGQTRGGPPLKDGDAAGKPGLRAATAQPAA
ncbi:hypothetical protein ABH920_009942 [Catenulispora sp. EB89]